MKGNVGQEEKKKKVPLPVAKANSEPRSNPVAKEKVEKRSSLEGTK